MSLKVIGAGFGRTGTTSLKFALERLGFAPCYHMREVARNMEHIKFWTAVALGETVDWRTFFKPYLAAVDWPTSNFWRELIGVFPDAKVVLTERDPEDWYRSMSATIFEYMRRADAFADEPLRGAHVRLSRLVVEEKTFGGRTDHDHAIAAYKEHNETVKAALPPARLLVYDIGQGWAPLCEFLGVAAPDAPFPRSNTTEEFRARRITGFRRD